MDAPIDLIVLEQRLAPLSHGMEALDVLRKALKPLRAIERQALLNAHLLRSPIYYDDLPTHDQLGIERFHILQGDVIRTEAAEEAAIRATGA